MQFYIKDVYNKAQSSGVKLEKVLFLPIYENMMESNKGYKFGEKLSEKNYHYVVIFDHPSEKLL